MRGLFDLDYLRKRLTYPNEPDILYLGLLGKRYIQQTWGLEKEYVAQVAGTGTNAANPILLMRHDLTLTGLYVKARHNCARRGWQLMWKNTRVLQWEALGVRPDAWLQVSEGERCIAAYVEFTDQLPSSREMARKSAGYEALFAERGPTRVLWLTTSRTKAIWLHDRLAPTYYSACYYLALLDKAGDWLTDRIWWVEDHQALEAFIGA